MSDVAIRVENLGKRYRIGALQQSGSGYRYKALRDVLAGAASAVSRRALAPFRRGRSLSSEETELWALKGLSFEIKAGEVVGIIGRNGAGKSTLLKVLSRVTEPTEGYARIEGRIGSLLEVGTGFHPELTGRENIYLNGAILGMKKAEIEHKFDEIVAFAEVDKFIDTPVKHFSSGMYLRLAFAVAAHLEPEILLVDEVLAVGDAAFQKKCLGKMGDVAKEGRTVLFVSHNMGAIVSLCQQGLLLNKGTVTVAGDITSVVSRYIGDSDLCGEYVREHRNELKRLSIDRISLLKAGHVATSFNNSETLVLRIECSLYRAVAGAQMAFEFCTETEEVLFSSTSQDANDKREFEPGQYVFEVPINLSIFRQGHYSLRVSSSVPSVEVLDIAEVPLQFELFDDSSPLLRLGQGRRGLILPVLTWVVSQVR